MKNIILFVGSYPKDISSIRDYERRTGRIFRVALLQDAAKAKAAPVGTIDIALTCSLDKPTAIAKTLAPYQHELLAVTCADEKSVQYLQKVIPHVPYLETPTPESLSWATSKVLMRRALRAYDKTISPAYTVIHDATPETMHRIEERIGFPLIVKPAGLAGSLLVSICYHPEELEKVLKRTLRKIRAVYKRVDGRGEPTVLIEQFMEGKLYSVDAYVNARGVTYFCPMVYVETGRAVGFDDFFGYRQMTPTIMKKENILAAHIVSKKAIRALCLRSTTVHIELMRTREGWKVVELGPRRGGFRHQLYTLSHDMNHIVNDILIRLSERPLVPRARKGYAVVMKFFARKEGVLVKLGGIQKIKKLASFQTVKINKKVGDKCKFVKYGGSHVLNVIMFNKDRGALLADIRRLEKLITIETA